VNGSGERGALGVALHPRWPEKKFVFVYVTRATSKGLRNQIVRIRGEGNRGAGLKVLLSTPASSSPYHNGGRILFGPDKMLYAMIGDGHNPANSQDRSANLRGKIVRLRPDGRVAPGNPGGTKYWAYGVRNSYGMAFDPQTDRLWETENGPSCNDEINLIVKNGNFGWGPQQACGSQATPGDTNNSGPSPRRMPKTWFTSPIGISGVAFCAGCGLGGGMAGDMFYGSVGDPMIRRFQMNAARNDVVGGAAAVVAPPNGVVYSIEVAPDGTIYFSDFEAIYRLTT
jgi:glucose/arabinose dehydrogenase